MPSDLAPGWRSPEQLSWIAGLVFGLKDALEIGTYCGRTTRVLIEEMTGHIFSVDPLDRATDVPSEATPDKTPWIKKLAREYPSCFTFIPALSSDLIWARPIDVLFLDGDHRFQGVYGDLLRFAHYIRPGGLIFLDALTHPTKPEVLPAWEAYLNRLDRDPLEYVGQSKHLHAYRNASSN